MSLHLQEQVIEQFMKLYNGPKLQEISGLSGIQVTRVFRLLNKAPMKLDEYVIFKKLIMNKKGMEDDIIDLIENCVEKLSSEGIIDVTTYIQRKLRLQKLMKLSSNDICQTSVC